MIYGLDGKIVHLKEMAFIERMLSETLLDPKDFYKNLQQFFKESLYETKTSFTTKDLDRIDNFVKEYFALRIEEGKVWLLRAYITGRLLVYSDLMQTAFEIPSVNRLPKFVEDAARKYGLTLEEAVALQQAVEEGASLMSNTTINTIQNVREALIENTKSGKGVQGFYDKIRELVKDEVGELNRDWQRVAITEANGAFNNGYLALCNEGDYVIGVSMPDACIHCLEDINGKVFRVRKEPAPDYSTMTGENYWKWAEVWETEVWVGKNNFGRSSSARKRINPRAGNKEENLRDKQHHEFTMPAIPYHPYCRDRWIRINPEYQFVDKDSQIRLRVEDEDAWEVWHNENIKQ